MCRRGPERPCRAQRSCYEYAANPAGSHAQHTVGSADSEPARMSPAGPAVRRRSPARRYSRWDAHPVPRWPTGLGERRQISTHDASAVVPLDVMADGMVEELAQPVAAMVLLLDVRLVSDRPVAMPDARSAWARGTSPAQGEALGARDKIDELRPRLE